MRRRNQVAIGLVLGLALVAGFSASAVSASQAVAGSSGCAQVLFVGARGTGELGPGSPNWNGKGDGLGGPVYGLYAALAQDLGGTRSIQMVSVVYDTSSVLTLLTDPAQYFANLQAGVTWTFTFLSQQATECPNQQIVLAGYSQGAMVMHRVLHELGTAILSRVSAAVLIADGDQVPNDTDVTRYGTAPLSAEGIGLLLPALSGSSTAPFSAAAGSLVLSVCNTGDIVCDANAVPSDFNPGGVAVHLDYTGTPPVLSAAQQAVQMLDVWTAVVIPIPANGVLGSARIGSVACPSATSCVISGGYTDTSGNAQGMIVTGSGTSWTAIEAPLPAQGEPGVQLGAVTCASASSCVVLGTYGGNAETQGNGLILTGSGTSWKATEAPLPANGAINYGVSLSSVSCPSTTSCIVVGQYIITGGYEGLLLTGSGTSWSATQAPLPANGATVNEEWLTSVACPSTSSCAVAGFYKDPSLTTQGLLLTGAGTSWTATEAPLPSNASVSNGGELNEVACLSVTSCVATGSYISSGAVYPEGMLVTGSGTSWTATEAPLPSNASVGAGFSLNSEACHSTTSCVISGAYTDSSGQGQGLLISGPGTSWQATEGPLPADGSGGELDSVACPSVTSCVISGDYTDSSGSNNGLLLTGAGTSWTATEAPLPGNAAASQDVGSFGNRPIACHSASSCVVLGYYTDSSGNSDAVLITDNA